MRNFDMDMTFYQKGGIKSESVTPVMRRIVINQLTRETQLISFEHPLVCLLETSSRKDLMVGEEVIREGTTYSDFYGFFTSPQEFLAEAEQKRRTGELEQRIIMEVSCRYASRCEEQPPHNYDLGRTKYECVPEDWIILDGIGRNTPEHVERWNATEFPDSIDISPRFSGVRDSETLTLWSSRNDAAANRALFVAALDAVGILTPEQKAKQLSDYDANVVPA